MITKPRILFYLIKIKYKIKNKNKVPYLPSKLTKGLSENLICSQQVQLNYIWNGP